MKVSGFYSKIDWWKLTKEFGADFEFESRPELNTRIWFRTRWDKAVNYFPSNSFFCAAYPLALYLGEELKFEGVVSTKLRANIPKINKYLGLARRKVNISCQTKKEEGNKKGIGVFFTLGLDSFYTLAKLKQKINKLIFIDGYDVYPEAREMRRQVEERTNRVAKVGSSQKVIVETNLRYDLSEKFMPWILYHGAALAAVGHIIKDLDLIYINGSDQYRNKIDWGTGEKIDRLWSSDNRKFRPFAGDKSRMEKIRTLAKSKKYRGLVGRNLRVCWQKFGEIEGLNCGKCEKCLRTYILMRLGGFGEKLDCFPEVNLAEINNLSLTTEKKFIWREIAREIKNNPDINREITQSLPVIEKAIK